MITSTRLLVLGVVRESGGPVHGYEVRRELLAHGATEWANIAPGSIYNALKTLVREELLEVVGTDRQGARPERTMYRLTEAGEREFTRLLSGACGANHRAQRPLGACEERPVRENLRDSRLPNHPLLAGLAFLPQVPRAELAEVLHCRADHLREQAADCRTMRADILASDPAAGGIPHHVAESYALLANLGEAAWAADLADRLPQGQPAACRAGRGLLRPGDRDRRDRLRRHHDDHQEVAGRGAQPGRRGRGRRRGEC